MTVVVTGASGMIGRALLGQLAATALPYRLLGRDPQRLARELGLPAHQVARLPEASAPVQAFSAALAGARHVVHCAALNSDADVPDDAYIRVNAELTGRLAEAAASSLPGRFVFLSSIRAMVGPREDAVLDETTPERPACAYGRSKLEGERRLAEAYRKAGRAGAASLRLAPVYGPGMRGNLARLARLADTPLPLPLAALSAPRSLLSADAAARAIATIIDAAEPPARCYLVADRRPTTVPGIVASFREGLGRPRRLVPASPAALAALLRLTGRGALWDGLSVSQVCDVAALERYGWQAERGSEAGLAAWARDSRSSLDTPPPRAAKALR